MTHPDIKTVAKKTVREAVDVILSRKLSVVDTNEALHTAARERYLSGVKELLTLAQKKGATIPDEVWNNLPPEK